MHTQVHKVITSPVPSLTQERVGGSVVKPSTYLHTNEQLFPRQQKQNGDKELRRQREKCRALSSITLLLSLLYLLHQRSEL